MVCMTLYDFLPRDENLANDRLLERFLDYVAAKDLELYDTQEAAILELFEEKNVILHTPTGSGKSLVAAALHFKALAQGKRSVYTCPVKALVNEKWMALCREFGPDNVGLSTGDATVNRDAKILCCTAEILSNIALREGSAASVDDVIMDEFHYYADRERGVAWQVPLLTLPQSRFLLMSATLGDTAFFEEEMTRRNGRPSATIRSHARPVPLSFAYAETTLARTVERLAEEGKTPVYVVHFTQREASQSAQDFTSINVCSRAEKAALSERLHGFPFNTPYGPTLRKWLGHGIALHHAGLLPKYRVLAEQLAQEGLLKIICGTDTLGVGINVPIRTVLFTKLCKFDGEKTGILSARDFHQISGRAGRKGFDDRGWVVVQAPEHFIENRQREEKAGRKGKKAVKRRPPDRNFVNWDENTFKRLVAATPERLASRFEVSHGMLLNVLSRPGDGCRAMRDLIAESHETIAAKKKHRRRAWQLFRSLLHRHIIEIVPPAADGTYLRVNVELQDDFAMDQTLSLYLIETLGALDPLAPDYALDLLSLVEAILEDPKVILQRQLDQLKSKVLEEMKREGIDYLQRMEEMDRLEYPKPKRDFIYSTFNAFADRHPWVGQENIRPKSIAREMFESFRSFPDYIRDYELQRSEGLLLRHLASTHKVLLQTVPENAKTEGVRELESYLGTLIREIDSTLLEEWERMREPAHLATPASSQSPQAESFASHEAPSDLTRDPQALLAAIRTRIFTFLRELGNGHYDQAIATLGSDRRENDSNWSSLLLENAMQEYFRDHQRLSLDPEARNKRHTYVQTHTKPSTWNVQQMLIDPDGLNDWLAEFEVDLEATRLRNEPFLLLRRLGCLAGVVSDENQGELED